MLRSRREAVELGSDPAAKLVDSEETPRSAINAEHDRGHHVVPLGVGGDSSVAKPANWTDISDVALLKRLRNSAEWLRLLCIELLRENIAYRLEEAISRTIRIVDGTIARQDGKPMNIAPRLSDRNMLRVRS